MWAILCPIKEILSPGLLEAHPGMYEIVSNFLEIGKYVQEKGQLARKVFYFVFFFQFVVIGTWKVTFVFL